MNLSFQNLFFSTATVFGLFATMVLAKVILIPLSIALLVSFILYPLVKKMESWGMNKIISAFISIFMVILIIGGFILFFSTQIIHLAKEFSNFQDKILLVFTEATIYINKNVNFLPNLKKDELFDMIKNWFNESTGALVKQTFSSTASFVAGLVATVVFTFLILIYRNGLAEALGAFAHKDKRVRVLKMFKAVQQVGQKYLFGMIILIIVIGLANSIGLLIIGIDNPFLFGFLAAIAAIIPYIGTIIGAVIPILYALVSYGSLWMAFAVAILFWAIQLVTDNFLTPKILGNSLDINALTSIISLVIGSIVWGIAGMILFLPFAAILRVICEEYEELKPIALLIGNRNYQKKSGIRWIEKIKSRFS